MHAHMTRRIALTAAVLLIGGTTAAWLLQPEEEEVPVPIPPLRVVTPAWVLPVEKARRTARKMARPLIIVSLNGNLDGYC